MARLQKHSARLILGLRNNWLRLTNPAALLTLDFYFRSMNIIGGMQGKQKLDEFERLRNRVLSVLDRLGMTEKQFVKMVDRWVKLGIQAQYVIER